MRGLEPPWSYTPLDPESSASAVPPHPQTKKMPEVRLELTRFVSNPRILSPVRLPVPPLRLIETTLFSIKKYVNIYFCCLAFPLFKLNFSLLTNVYPLKDRGSRGNSKLFI